MPKPKHGPALFDLLGEDSGEASNASKLPQRWAADEQDSLKPASKPSADIASGKRLRIADPLEAQSDTGARLLELDSDRIRVSFTSRTAALAIFIAVILLAGAFGIGRRSGYQAGLGAGFQQGRDSYAAETFSDIEAARNQPPATHLVSGLMERAEAQPTRPEPVGEGRLPDSTEPHWIRGYTYVVAQEFVGGDADAAAKAQAFLAEHGIATAVVRFDSGSVQLITTQGYNHRDPAQKRMAQEFLKKVHGVGAKYYAAGGGYKLDGYFKTRKEDRW